MQDLNETSLEVTVSREEDFPTEILHEWDALLSKMENIHGINVTRQVWEEGIQYKLHFFSNDSPKPYSVTQIYTPRARVGKLRTLPQLELTTLLYENLLDM